MGVTVRKRGSDWWIFIHHKGRRKAKKIGRDKHLAKEIAKKIEMQLVLEEFGLLSNKGGDSEHIPSLKEYFYGWTDESGRYNLGWLDKHGKVVLKESTWRSYRNIFDVHVLPELGSFCLNDLTPKVLGDFLAKKLRGGLRSATVKNIKHALSSVLSYAQNPDEIIDRNPLRGIKVAKPMNEVPSREPDPFDWEERRVLEKIFERHFPRYYPLIVVAFRTGLRFGELIALQWKDVDFRRRTIMVRRSIARGRLTTPKSKAGIREVRLSKQAVEALKLARIKLKEEALKNGWSNLPEWVFPNTQGGPLHANNFRKRVWKRAMELSGLRWRTIHDMRHTYATLRLSKGDSLAEVAKEMGHSSASVTFKVYYKWLPEISRSDVDELDDKNATKRNLYATRRKKGLSEIR